MSTNITIHLDVPPIYGLSGWHMGESSTATGALAVVASGDLVGSYPEWDNTFTYPSGDASYYYAVRFVTDEDVPTSYSPRSLGKYDSINGFLVYPTGNILYLIPPAISGVIPNWLDYNTEYTVTVKASGLWGNNTTYMEEDYEFFFTSQYCPLWSTVTDVRLAAGPLIDSVPDDTINRMIYRSSIKSIQRFLNGNNVYGCTWSDVPEPLFRWVTCVAALMSLNAAAAAGGAGGGDNTSKKLGALSITYGGGSDGGLDSGDVRRALDQCVRESADLIGAQMGTKVQYAVKAYRNTIVAHPQNDATWGRNPRFILENGTNGPWHESHEYGKYFRGQRLPASGI